jgi:hypothetical protein
VSRHRAADDPDVRAAARDLAATTLEDHVRRVIDTFPPLTPAQCERLADLFGPIPRRRTKGFVQDQEGDSADGPPKISQPDTHNLPPV